MVEGEKSFVEPSCAKDVLTIQVYLHIYVLAAVYGLSFLFN